MDCDGSLPDVLYQYTCMLHIYTVYTVYKVLFNVRALYLYTVYIWPALAGMEQSAQRLLASNIHQ